MGSKVFLYLFVAANLLLILWMLAVKRTSRPTPLSMGNEPKSSPKSEVPNMDDTTPGFNSSLGSSSGSSSGPSSGPSSGLKTERSLNCQFMFNGHSFDAYEVLGLPAGASLDACLRATLDLRRRRPQDGEFLDALVTAVQMQIPR